jgi:hypothetical protein
MAGVNRTIAAVCAAIWMASAVFAQDAVYPGKPSPPKIEPQIILLAESVVQTQWVHTLDLVNAPQNVSLLNPGQCIRVAIYSTGDGRDVYLEKTKLFFRVKFAGHNDDHAFAFPAARRQIKPEGGDFVSAVLGAAGVKQPADTKTMASLGVSADHWCAPADSSDGTAVVEAEVESPSGQQALTSSTINIESFEAGSKKLFKNKEELGAFLQTYYRQPNPARLLPALQFMVGDQTQTSRQGQVEIFSAFLSAAANSDPAAAQDFRARIALQPRPHTISAAS